jgi:hypothetical protein
MNATNASEVFQGSQSFTPNAENIVAAFFVSLLIVMTLVGNGLVFASFYMFADLRTICNYFIVSLSLADILVALLAMPFWLHLQLTSNQWVLSKGLKMFWDCIDILGGTASITNLTAVSVDRMLAITAPFRYPKLVTSRRALIVIACVWVYAISVSCARTALWPGRSFLVFVSIVCFFLPLSIVILMYLVIFLVVRTQVKRIGKNHANEMKAAKTIAVVIGGFLLCWLPFFTVILGHAFSTTFRPPFALFFVIKWLEYFNSCLNPIIYTCMNRTYRRAFKRLFRRCYLKLYPSGEGNSVVSQYLSQGPRGSLLTTTVYDHHESGNVHDQERQDKL